MLMIGPVTSGPGSTVVVVVGIVVVVVGNVVVVVFRRVVVVVVTTVVVVVSGTVVVVEDVVVVDVVVVSTGTVTGTEDEVVVLGSVVDVEVVDTMIPRTSSEPIPGRPPVSQTTADAIPMPAPKQSPTNAVTEMNRRSPETLFFGGVLAR